ncbi:MAG: EcsC family protein [Anaerostipes sp.]|nr:EcsC family protein [Anaerostipes sp.]
MKQKLDEKQMVTVLDELYGKVLNGIPKVSKPVDALANDYLLKNNSPKKAAKELTKYQIAKCGTSGFITGLGGIITLPVAIPANVSSVLYVQLRMVAAIAYMGDFDIQSDQVQTLAYACLTGSAIADVLKQTGIKVGEKIAISAINKVPGKVLTSINQKVGFRLITRFGTKGAVNLVKLVPVAGGIIGGAIDIGSTNIIARNAYTIFIKKEMPSDAPNKSTPKGEEIPIVESDINSTDFIK